MAKSNKIVVQGATITVVNYEGADFISLTDMIKDYDNNRIIIGNWLRRRNTLDFLGLWEQLNNPDFKLIEFDELRQDSGLNSFTLSSKQWIEKTNAIGIISKSGRFGGTYAHKDVAFKFASWLSVEFELYLIKEFQRLKEEESNNQNLEWKYRRFLSKVNYKIHTDSVKENIIPRTSLPEGKQWLVYADEADILNIALFGQTAKEWREENPSKHLNKSNIRDYATIEQLTVLANLESLNALMIREGIKKENRLLKLRETAIFQLNSLLEAKSFQSPMITNEDIAINPPEQKNLSGFNKNLKTALGHNPKGNE